MSAWSIWRGFACFVMERVNALKKNSDLCFFLLHACKSREARWAGLGMMKLKANMYVIVIVSLSLLSVCPQLFALN